MRPEDTYEVGLIERICLGEKDLFHDLIRPYERKVYLTALALLGSETEAEDAAQETMIKAFRNLRSFRSESRFSTWLTSIALNEARSRLRKSKRVQIESLEERAESYEGDFTPAMLTDWREIPSEALERSELRTALRAAVSELPPIYREVFTLRDLEELNVEETAKALGVTGKCRQGPVASSANDAAKAPRSVPEGFLFTPARALWEGAMELNCKHVWEFISDYIDGSVDSEVRSQIERHLENCEICSAILDSTRNILYLTADDRTFTLPIGYSERLHLRLELELGESGAADNQRT